MSYCRKFKTDWKAKTICGSDGFLESCEKIEGIAGAMWIWGYFYTRSLYRRDFEVTAPVKKATAQFICDNVIDFYVNGQAVIADTKTLCEDITRFLKVGTNAIAIRAFQTNREDRFTSGLCGKIEVETETGAFTVVTDQDWESLHPVGFSTNEEPRNWTTASGLKTHQMFSSRLHPRQVKRSMYVRKGFILAQEIASAELSVYAQGEAEMYLNGRKIGDTFFNQGIITKYREYFTLDVTDYLQVGKNALGAITGNTWYVSQSHSGTFNRRNILLAELTVRYKNGETFLLGTDSTFKTYPSPILDNHLQFGERYDARLAVEHWCEADFDDSSWYFAQETEEENPRPYIEKNYPPIKIQKQLPPQKVWTEGDAVYYDFGFNGAGTFTIGLQNTVAGQSVKITAAEQFDANGNFVVKSYAPVFYPEDYGPQGRAKAAMKNYNVYTCRGGQEQYTPRFTFNGFRYLRVEGAKPEQIAFLKQNILYNDLSFQWDIACSDPFYKDLALITERAMQSNLFNGFMDCPTREKNFWTGDIGMFGATACYFADCDSLLARWTDAGRKMCDKVYGWGDEVYTIPLELYQFYGDIEVLRLRWSDILTYARWRISEAGDVLPKNANSPFNDHLNPFDKNLEGDYFAACYYCHMFSCVAQIAHILQETEIESEFKARFAEACAAFQDRYFLPEVSDYTPRSQSGMVLPLAFGITPPAHRQAVAARLNQSILEQGCLTTGFVATRFLMQLLCDYGYTDTAFMLLQREEYPSWRHILSTGATSMTEHWTGMDLIDEGGSSKNHFCLGTVVGWMFEYLGGIRYKESAPGFQKLHLQPVFIKEIGDFAVAYGSRQGVIETAWRFDGGKVIFDFTSPVETEVHLPDGQALTYPAGKHNLLFEL